jgi:stage II sporulation protein D
LSRAKLVVRSAGLAWTAAFAGAWLAAASCRTTRDIQLVPLPLASVQLLEGADLGERPIRVGVRVDVGRATLSAPGGVTVRGAAAGENVALVRSLPSATFEASAASATVRLLETGDELQGAAVTPADPEALLAIDGSPYRGVAELLPAPLGLTVVNIVPLEEYLRGVVPNELAPAAFPQLEALMAQAVAARSYALAHLGDYASRGFDVCATPACQAYRGTESEHWLTDRAVAETRGVVATWRGRPIHAFYTSTCGGHTEDGSAVLEENAPYLRGVACPAERDLAPGVQAIGEWRVRLRRDAITRSLARYGEVGGVLDLVPTRTGVSGRVVELRVEGTQGSFDLRGQRIQLGLGLRESFTSLEREKGRDGAVVSFVVTGRGWGHGVGLCQVGASGMARGGASFEAILKHYYTGVSVASLEPEPAVVREARAEPRAGLAR